MGKKTDTLTCYEVQHSIRKYIMNEMAMEEAATFVKHVRSCPACREELEAYYAFSTALMQLEPEEETPGNFGLNIEKRLENTELALLKQKKEHWARRFTYAVLAIVLATVMGISIGV